MSADAEASPVDVDVVRLSEVEVADVAELVGRFRAGLRIASPNGDIPGSYWGGPEAGLVGDDLHARRDTPLHSVLHELSHYVCMSGARRLRLLRDAGGDDLEESAVCYLSIVLADHVPGMGRARMLSDMDAWGYSFRLGSSARWFEADAEDARLWLSGQGILDESDQPTYRRRDDG